MKVNVQMDPLAFLTKEELIQFFHCKKTERSCMQEPLIFLHQLRDHNLVPEKLYKKVIKMKCKEKRRDGVYQILDWLEKERSDSMRLFWSCVFRDYILQLYPALRLLRNSLMDGSFRVYENLPEPEDHRESANKSAKVKKTTAKKKKSEKKRKKSTDEMEKEEQQGQSCHSTSKQKKRGKKSMSVFSESSAEMEGSDEKVLYEQSEVGEKQGREEEDDTGPVDPSVFETSSLPVSCGSVSGVLDKGRFVSGSRSKSIRTEKRWFTPEEFVKQESTLTDGHWKKDIRCHGKTFNYLLKKKILVVHSLLCNCDLCRPKDQDLLNQNNDDECFICDSSGILLCCDECPRAFHHQCHIPMQNVQDDTRGEKWTCTFCKLKTNQREWQSRQMTEKVLDSSISEYRLHCEYLLLHMYQEDTEWVFTEDPTKTVSGYSREISDPMWLNRVKTKLQKEEYKTLGQFVSDVRLIFKNCHIFNKGNRFDKMGSRLREVFEREFKTIFNSQ